MAEVIKVRNVPAQHIGVVNSAPCPEMNIITKEITENGRYSARAEGATGFDPVIVNIEDVVTADDLTFSGKIPYLFQYGNWSNIVKRFGKMMRFNDITDVSYLCYDDDSVEDLSELNMTLDGCLLNNMFNKCTNLKKLPNVNGSIFASTSSMFQNCLRLTSDEINKFFSGLTYKYSNNASPGFSSTFYGCCSIRDLTETFDWLDNFANSYDKTNTGILSFGNMLVNSYCLDEITSFPVVRLDMENKSNSFSGTFNSCLRIKNLIFKTDNGVPYKVKWKSQTIDLTQFLGYARTEGNIIDYNSGITSDKRVRNASTYDLLKNDPDWYTTSSDYSRYNHDSAVNTINSLPDTSEYLASAGGTNTIKFSGKNGSNTDGGAINTLTAEEIAVATAKGWTVTLS